MGACLSCCAGKSSSSGGGVGGRRGETEMTGRSDQNGESSTTVVISRKMSAPTITITDNVEVSGSGLALASVVVEQDAAYWEWHITSSKKPSENDDDGDGEEEEEEDEEVAVKFGVATRKDQKFYRALQSNDENGDDTTSMEDGTALMRAIVNLRHGDTVGVAVQQSDLPMIQFLCNGEPLHELAINRFRGAVYPAIYLPQAGTAGVQMATLVHQEDDFREVTPHARFGPLLAARGLI